MLRKRSNKTAVILTWSGAERRTSRIRGQRWERWVAEVAHCRRSRHRFPDDGCGVVETHRAVEILGILRGEIDELDGARGGLPAVAEQRLEQPARGLLLAGDERAGAVFRFELRLHALHQRVVILRRPVLLPILEFHARKLVLREMEDGAEQRGLRQALDVPGLTAPGQPLAFDDPPAATEEGLFEFERGLLPLQTEGWLDG